MLKILYFYIRSCVLYEKKFSFVFFLFSPFVAILQSLGILSIFPLISILLDPGFILQNDIFIKYYPIDFISNHQLLIQLTVIFFLLNLISLIFLYLSNILTEYIAGKVVFSIQNDILKKSLQKSNNLNILQNRSEFINLINHQIPSLHRIIIGTLSLSQSLTILLAFFISLVFFELNIIFYLFAVCVLYFLIYQLNKNFVKDISYKQKYLQKKRNQIITYIQMASKDLLVLKASKKIIHFLNNTQNNFLSEEVKKLSLIYYPRYLFELILYLIIVYFVYFEFQNFSLLDSLNTLSVIALFLWKSIPIFFNIFRQFSTVNSTISNYKDITKFDKIFQKKNSKIFKISNFKNKIELKKILFSYNKSQKFLFDLEIKKGEKICISGESGTGKTTLLNIITGLLDDFIGEYRIDGVNLKSKNYKTEIFGYLTQDFFLFSGSIYENINLFAKNHPKKKDIIELKKIYDICGLKNIIENFDEIFTKKLEINSPELSGGQKQRIAIARTLYLNPSVLIFDEATNALDYKSEKRIIEKIIKNYSKITLIFITHRKVDIKFDKKKRLIKEKNQIILK